MNSYPIELLVQHAPLMFVAGLEDHATPHPGVSVNSDALPSPKQERRGSVNQDARDSFAVLTSRLRNSFASRRRGVIWDLNKSHHFNVVLVDKNVKFPPRKIVPSLGTNQPDGTSGSTHIPRSPLSPLNPSSPLYPDGIIAPIWVRKHTELVPCVFVLFMRLWEPPPPASPLEAHTAERDEERRWDAELASEIGARKKATSERGIKLTVVLMASRKMLDDPNLDTRLSFIRRQSGLDARAALFVLSPLSTAELNEFIESLQEALFESAVDYYSSHSKRVRRKKSRYPQQPAPLPPGSGPIVGRPLRNEGWIVRYEYKMATFAEFRMEIELARKHYEDCWEALLYMFNSPAILPPRTKRWAEARVLADSVSFKICKLHLYQSEYSRTIAHFNRHLRRLIEFSRNWGINEGAFEFWAWAARQYRLFAELLDRATRAGIQLPSVTGFPTSVPPSLPTHASSNSVASIPEHPNQPFGLNPVISIQHAGYYFFAAASCTQRRYHRYMVAASQEDPSSTSSPALANERKIDHQSIILELYTKAYEIFKAQQGPNDRMTFHTAYRIAETYYNAGKYELGSKFFERVAKIYRSEHWGAMLHSVLSMWCECARQSGNVDATVPLLLEMIGLRSVSPEERTTLEEELTEILKSTSPSKSIHIEPSDTSSLLIPSVVFWQDTVFVGEPTSFQLRLTPLPGALLSLVFSSMHLYWDEHEPPLVIEHSEDEDPCGIVQLGNVDRLAPSSTDQDTPRALVKAALRWRVHNARVFSGSITSHSPADLQLFRVALFLKQKDWEIEVVIPLARDRLSSAPSQWVVSAIQPTRFVPVPRREPFSCPVIFRPHALRVTFEHVQPAYLEEHFPIDVVLTNLDTQELEFEVDILMQPTADESVNEMTMGHESSTSLIKGIAFGRLYAGESSRRRLLLLSSGNEGERVLDFSIQSRAIPSPSALPGRPQDINETLHTLVIQTVPALQLATQSTFARDPLTFPGLFELSRYEQGFFHRSCIASISAQVIGHGPWDVILTSIKLIPETVHDVRLGSLSLSQVQDDFPIVLKAGDAFSIVCDVDIADVGGSSEYAFPGSLEILWKRASSDSSLPLCRSLLRFPNMQPPEDDLIGILKCPPSAQLHEAFSIHLVVQNRHPSRTADIYLDVDSSDAFVLAGPRHAHLPALLPGTSEEISYKIFPLLTGVVRLPNFRLYDRRKPFGVASGGDDEAAESGVDGGGTGKPIHVVMVGKDVRFPSTLTDALRSVEDPHVHTILVYPY